MRSCNQSVSNFWDVEQVRMTVEVAFAVRSMLFVVPGVHEQTNTVVVACSYLDRS
jgi:hypothetical protein